MLRFGEWLQGLVVFETPESGGGAAPPAGDGGGEGAAAAPSVDLSPVLERMDEFTQRLGTVEEYFADDPDPDADPDPSFAPAPGGQQAPAFGQQGVPPFGQPGQAPQLPPGLQSIPGVGIVDQYGRPVDPAVVEQYGAAQALQSYIAQQVQQGVQQGIQPYTEAQQDYIDQQKSAALEQRWPELSEPANAQALVDSAREYGQAMGLSEQQALNPDFLELVQQARGQAAAAAGETPAGQSNGAQLEGGGGANPPSGEGPDEADLILNSGPGQSFLTGAG